MRRNRIRLFQDYDEAISLQPSSEASLNILFNKGNALVTMGRFDEALECYRPINSEAVIQNRSTLEWVLSVIGSKIHSSEFHQVRNSGLGRLVVRIDGPVDVDRIGVFAGRVGNTVASGWQREGGKGFRGKEGFMVELVGKVGSNGS